MVSSSGFLLLKKMSEPCQSKEIRRTPILPRTRDLIANRIKESVEMEEISKGRHYVSLVRSRTPVVGSVADEGETRETMSRRNIFLQDGGAVSDTLSPSFHKVPLQA